MQTIRYLLLLILIVTISACQDSSREIPNNTAEKNNAEVVLYSTSWCGYCEKTRKLFKEKNIAYIERDIEKSREARQDFHKLGGKGVPVVVINGQVVKGYNPKAVLKLLNET